MPLRLCCFTSPHPTPPHPTHAQGMGMVIASIFLYNLPVKDVVGMCKGFWPEKEAPKPEADDSAGES